MQLYTGSRSRYIWLYRMNKRSEFILSLLAFITDVGIMDILVSDGAAEQINNAVKAILRKYNIRSGKAYHQHQNQAEQRIADLKELGFLIQSKEGVPYDEWDDELLHACDLRNKRALRSLNWRTPHELVFGETPDVSVFKQFRFWGPVRYTTPGINFPDNPDQAGRFIRITWSTGDILTYKIRVDEARLDDNRYVVVEQSAVVSDRGDNLTLNENAPNERPFQMKNVNLHGKTRK